jgi:hypothetical protein
VSLQDVAKEGWCNNNNHKAVDVEKFGETPITEQTYWDVLRKTHFNKWFHLKGKLHGTIGEEIVQLSREHVSDIILASKSAVLTGQLPSHLKEELEDIEKIITPVCVNPPYFVRLESASLKDGERGAGPFMNGKDILVGMCTSKRVIHILEKEIRDGQQVFPVHYFHGIQI